MDKKIKEILYLPKHVHCEQGQIPLGKVSLNLFVKSPVILNKEKQGENYDNTH